MLPAQSGRVRARSDAAAGALASTDFGPHYAALIGDAQQDPELARAPNDRLIGHLPAEAAKRIKAAQEQGQIRADVAPELVIDLLYGPTYYRWLIRRTPPDARHIEAVVDAVLAGVAG